MDKLFLCVNHLFINEDIKSKIKKKDIHKHSSKESPWILIDNYVYSIGNKDKELLDLFTHFYGKDVKHFLLNQFNNNERILILEKLKKRKIGIII